jgi:geranylgeranyl diphosphate synthase, type I
VLAYPLRGGKMLRPALVLWSCGVFGGEPRLALPVAAAVEVFHNWTLVHDDIIDQDDFRRGAPSVHRLISDLVKDRTDRADEFGVAIAILAGDVQQAWSNRLVLGAVDVPAPIRLSLLSRLNNYVNPRLISGEALDVEFELRPFADITPDELTTMLRNKTALLLRFSAESGAMIGLRTDDPEEPRVKRLGHLAEAAGLAFQLRDDVLGMFADEKKLGKPVGSDLRRGKRTFLFALGLHRMSDKDRAQFLQYLGNPSLTAVDCAQAGKMLRDCGALAETEKLAQTCLESALVELEELPKNRYHDLLEQWVRFVAARDY